MPKGEGKSHETRNLHVSGRGKERDVGIRKKRAHVLGFFSCKGGVGKTTTAANVGLCMAQILNNNALVVDANLAAPNLGLHFGMMDPKATICLAFNGSSRPLRSTNRISPP